METTLNTGEQNIYNGVFEDAIERGCTEAQAKAQAERRIKEIREFQLEMIKAWTK
jgi:hypothetical protein